MQKDDLDVLSLQMATLTKMMRMNGSLFLNKTSYSRGQAKQKQFVEVRGH